MNAQRILASGAAALLVLIVLAIVFHDDGSDGAKPTTLPTTAPGTLRAHVAAGGVTLDGPVADADERKAIESAAGDRFGKENVLSRLQVVAGADSAEWLASAMPALPRAGDGFGAIDVIATKTTLTVRGRVPTAAAGKDLLEAVREASGRKVTDELEIVGQGATGLLQKNIDDAVKGRTIAFNTGSAGITKAGQNVLAALVHAAQGGGLGARGGRRLHRLRRRCQGEPQAQPGASELGGRVAHQARSEGHDPDRQGLRRGQADRLQQDRGRPPEEPAHRIHRAGRIEGALMGTAGEIVIWMVLAALVGFATGWALRSVVANRARARLSERLEEKRREAQELREELRHLRGDDEEDEDVVHVPSLGSPWADDDEEEELEEPQLGQTVVHVPAAGSPWGDDGDEELEESHLGATAEHDEVELGPLDEPEPTEAQEEEGEEIGGSTRAMRLDEVEWEDVEDPPRRRDDEA